MYPGKEGRRAHTVREAWARCSSVRSCCLTAHVCLRSLLPIVPTAASLIMNQSCTDQTPSCTLPSPSWFHHKMSKEIQPPKDLMLRLDTPVPKVAGRRKQDATCPAPRAIRELVSNTSIPWPLLAVSLAPQTAQLPLLTQYPYIRYQRDTHCPSACYPKGISTKRTRLCTKDACCSANKVVRLLWHLMLAST